MQDKTSGQGDQSQINKDIPSLISEINNRMSSIDNILTKQFPDRKLKWFEKLHIKIQTFVKYIGIPALVLAAIVPVYNLIGDYINYSNGLYVKSVLASYASELLEKNEIDRANFVIKSINDLDKYDVTTQYMKAKILAKTAIKQGRRYSEAKDIINILLLLQNNRRVFFPKLGGPNEIFELQMDLVDIYSQLSLFTDAESMLKSIEVKNNYNEEMKAEVELRRGKIHVLQYQIKDVKEELTNALGYFQRNKKNYLTAECFFTLGKFYQFQSDLKNSLINYSNSQKLFEGLNDKFYLLKVYNNTGMLYLDQSEYSKAKFYFEQERKTSLEINDSLSLARSLVNLSLIAKSEFNYNESISYAMQAKEAFLQQGDKLGVAASAQNLANTYEKLGDYSKCLFFSNQALIIFQDLRDIRGIARTFGVLGNANEKLNSMDDLIYYKYGSIIFNRYFNYDKEAAGNTDIKYQMQGLSSAKERLGIRSFTFYMNNAKVKLKNLVDELGLDKVNLDLEI